MLLGSLHRLSSYFEYDARPKVALQVAVAQNISAICPIRPHGNEVRPTTSGFRYKPGQGGFPGPCDAGQNDERLGPHGSYIRRDLPGVEDVTPRSDVPNQILDSLIEVKRFHRRYVLGVL